MDCEYPHPFVSALHRLVSTVEETLLNVQSGVSASQARRKQENTKQRTQAENSFSSDRNIY